MTITSSLYWVYRKIGLLGGVGYAGAPGGLSNVKCTEPARPGGEMVTMEFGDRTWVGEI